MGGWPCAGEVRNHVTIYKLFPKEVETSDGTLPLLGSSGSANAAAKDKWIEIGAQLECDGYNGGEVYLESSRGKVPTLAECKASCESAKGCKSISYFKSGWCSYWATPCKKSKWRKKVVISLQLTYVADVKKEEDKQESDVKKESD